MVKKRDRKWPLPGTAAKSGSDSNDVTVHGDSAGAGPVDPGATVLGANADTLEDERAAGRTLAAPSDAPPTSGDGTDLAASAGDDEAGQPQQATQVSAPQPSRDRDRIAPHPDDVPTSPDALVEQGGDAALDATFLSGANQAGGAVPSGATKPPKEKGRKDVEDFFETLIEDPQQKRKPGDVAGLVIGDYQVVGELGRGGMGVVYKARHRKLDRVVALKMILAGQHAGSEVVERFISEARAVAHLQHPGIVQIFDIGEHKGLPWFSLEFVEGTDLQHFLAGQPQHPRDAAQMVVQISEAMQYAHDNDILHRDLKPANILLDQDKRPKVTDFGLAMRSIRMIPVQRATGRLWAAPATCRRSRHAGSCRRYRPDPISIRWERFCIRC